LTFYELTEGDMASTTDFRGLHPAILRKALDTLVKRGKAQIIRGGEGDGDGVRFL
jgi:ESCRT-II complex subunit VPS25